MKMITKWEDLVGKTIERVEIFLGDPILFIADSAEVAFIRADGEERHGRHWPVLETDPDSLL